MDDDKIGDVVGVLGHRDLASNRGRGDPGARIMNLLGMAGYEPINFDISDDLDIWRRRQRELGMDKIDGVPGPLTVGFLRAKGKPGPRGKRIPLPSGLWILRPGDELGGPSAPVPLASA